MFLSKTYGLSSKLLTVGSIKILNIGTYLTNGYCSLVTFVTFFNHFLYSIFFSLSTKPILRYQGQHINASLIACISSILELLAENHHSKKAFTSSAFFWSSLSLPTTLKLITLSYKPVHIASTYILTTGLLILV